MRIYSFSVKPLSQHLSAALNVCNTLTTSELFELAISVGRGNHGGYQQEWATAIASVVERRSLTTGRLN